MDGSSPLARGTPLCQERHNVLTRFIPACAGNSFQKFPLLCLQPVHPRLRGELVSFNTIPSGNGGSSPLARGTPGAYLVKFRDSAVHPRLRGELEQGGIPPFKSDGSSPLARGTLLLDGNKCTNIRFIPACAGNSIQLIHRNIGTPVHPRLRGELVLKVIDGQYGIGSSPLARGTLSFRRANSSSRRFIPACAGNSQLFVCCFGERSVHPRLRGELAVNSGYLTSNPRFIPACAGNSGVRSVHKSFVPVHPRLREELCTEPKLLTIAFGSSPLARGTLHNRLSVFVYPRFIPACAGNSPIGTRG